MTVPFHAVARRNPRDPEAPPKYYPQVKSRDKTTLRQLAERIADISTVSSVDTMAVLEALLKVIPQELADGNLVQLGELGSFSLRTRTTGSETAEEVTAHNIINTLPGFRPGKLFKDELDQITFEKE